MFPSFLVNGKQLDFPLLLIAGGRAPEQQWLSAVAENKQIYCADKGMDACYQLRVTPRLIVGDMDSCTTEALQHFKNLGTPIKTFDSNKDLTDFQLLLEEIANNQSGNIICTGVWGGRFDHLYSIVQTIKHAQNSKTMIVMADSCEMMLFMDQHYQQISISNMEVDNISLLPLNNDTVVSIKGVQWSLDRENITMEQVYTISNNPVQPQTDILLHQGNVAVYLNFKNKVV